MFPTSPDADAWMGRVVTSLTEHDASLRVERRTDGPADWWTLSWPSEQATAVHVLLCRTASDRLEPFVGVGDCKHFTAAPTGDPHRLADHLAVLAGA